MLLLLQIPNPDSRPKSIARERAPTCCGRVIGGFEPGEACRDTGGMIRPALLVRLLSALLLLLPAALCARPALWVVKDADTTIYLFGTVHLLPGDAGWRDPALDHALEASDTLYLETVDDDPANMAALVMHYGLSPGKRLSAQLSPSEAHRLQLAANKAKVPGGMPALEMMRPWLAALTLTTAPLLQAGLDPAQGVDKQLRATMEKRGKPVLGLETAEQQVRFLADMPQAAQLAMLRSTLREVDKGIAQLTAMVKAWQQGDTDQLARLGEGDMREHEPQLYQRLLVQRNEAWAQRISTMLEQPGTVFIAVGAAHLAGPDSVQVQLQKRGVESTRQ